MDFESISSSELNVHATVAPPAHSTPLCYFQLLNLCLSSEAMHFEKFELDTEVNTYLTSPGYMHTFLYIFL